MKRFLVCFVLISVIFLPFSLSFASVESSAYVSASSLYDGYFAEGKVKTVSFDSDGLFLVHAFYKSAYDPAIINSSDSLSYIQFISGTWHGSSIDELDSRYFYNQEVNGISQVMSYTDEGGYFLYSVIWSVPVVAGDSFSLSFNYNSDLVSAQSYYRSHSFIPGGTGIKLVENFSKITPAVEPLTYTTNSTNQHLVCVVFPDKFNSSYGGDYFFHSLHSESLASSVNNLSRIASCIWSSVYTTPYLLDSGSEISVDLKSTVTNYSFSVYEIFTDGTTTSGLDTGEPITLDTSSGSSSESVDLSGITSYLVQILNAIKEKDVTFKPSDEVMQKLDDILSGMDNLPENIWAVFEVGLNEMFGGSDTEYPVFDTSSSDSQSVSSNSSNSVDSGTPSFEMSAVDQESFDSVIDSIDVDNFSDSVIGSHGAISFFWTFFDKFATSLNLYPIIILSLAFTLIVWLLRG